MNVHSILEFGDVAVRGGLGCAMPSMVCQKQKNVEARVDVQERLGLYPMSMEGGLSH